jgi:LysM repeat protein
MERKDRKSIGLVGGPNQYVTDISEFISIEGYKRDSPDVNKPFNIIPSGNITMEGVDFPVYGRDNLGNEQIMKSGGNYQFPGDSVLETRLAQDGTEMPYEGDIPSPMEDPNGFLYQIEDLVGYHLDYPNGKGETFATMPGEENSIDNLRHAGSARYTAEAIGKKVKEVPYVGGLLDFVGVDKAAGFIGANVLGLGHELTSFFGEDERSFLTKLQEMGEDSFNNLVGSIVGSTDMDSDKKDKLLKKLSFNNLLPDGYVSTENGRKNGLSEDIYFKDEEGKRKTPEYKRGGGLLDKTMECNSCGWEWKAADGGADVSTCHKCGGSALPKAQDGLETINEDALIQEEKSSLNKWGHGILDAAGLVPGFGEIADGVNAAWYAAEGDNVNAALSTAAMVPFLGWGATATKFGLKGVKALKGSKNIAKEVIENTVKVADDVKPSWSRGVTNYGKSPEGIQDALSSMKSQGKHLDEIGFNVDDVIAPNVINHGNKYGRQIAEVALPNGQSQLFYKSSGLAGKKGAGKTGTTEGLWQPYGGHASTGATDNWFIKDAGYENFYDSNSFKAIANKLDEIESGWDMSKQVLKSELKYGGVPKAQRGGSTQRVNSISNDIYLRQTFAESSFKPGAKSNVGAQGLTQFMPDTIEYLIERGTLPEDFDIHDPKQAVMAQKLYMEDIYNKDFINKPNQSDQVRLAKTLAAYNGGPTRLKNILTAQKNEGVDIYNSLDWMSALPKESKEYIDLILLNKNTTGRPKFNENFDSLLIDENYKKYIDLYQQGGSVNYTVAAGDNLGKIANKYNTSVQEIVDLNNIEDANKIGINQELIIPSSQMQEADITSAYKVRSGDTLGKIAKTYNTTAKNLAEYNGIKNMNMIQVDQQISIPDNIRKQVKKPEPAWYGVDDVKTRNTKTNSQSDTNIIMQSQLLNNPNQSYVIIDKKSGQLRVMNGEDEALSFEVLTGDNPGDAQTVTKMVDQNNDGKITDQDRNRKNQWVTDWSAGNKSTGAGIYSISASSPTSKPGYQNAPSWNLINDNGIEVSTAIHGTTNYRKQFFNDGNTENNQASNGCINGQCSDLDALYDLDLPMGTPIFILPEDEGNNFMLQDGKAIMKMSQENRSDYLDYTDSKGRTQKGQGGNYTTNTLVYKPIKAQFNEEKFKKERFTAFDFNDTEELENSTIPFIQALENNKKKIMQEAQISGDVYNQIAKIAFGVYGTESEFGDTHSWVGNAARGANKKYGTDGSSPDITKKYEGFDLPFTEAGAGAQSNNNSVGYTQIRWSQLNDKEKKVLRAFDITSNEDFLDPTKSAIATASILGVRYNEQLTGEQKKNIWANLPGKWNNRANYADRVKENSVYLDFQQKDVMENGGEIENHIMYKNYVNGVYEGSKMETKGAKIYDKLNRIHYRDAKASNMTPSNYVMTNVIG